MTMHRLSTVVPGALGTADTISAEDDDALWTVGDVARYLKASRSWVYHRAESGQLPCLRVGGLLRFDPDAIRAYARGQPAAGQKTSLLKVAGALRRGQK